MPNGAAPHDHHNPTFPGDQISQSEAQQLARKLAKKDDTIQHLSQRNQELCEEVERLREALAQIANPERSDSVVNSAPADIPVVRVYEQRAADALNDGGDDHAND